MGGRVTETGVLDALRLAEARPTAVIHYKNWRFVAGRASLSGKTRFTAYVEMTMCDHDQQDLADRVLEEDLVLEIVEQGVSVEEARAREPAKSVAAVLTEITDLTYNFPCECGSVIKCNRCGILTRVNHVRLRLGLKPQEIKQQAWKPKKG